MKFLAFFLFLWVIFAFLNPDSDSVSILPDSDPAYNFISDQDPTFYFNACRTYPDPAAHQSEANLRSPVHRLPRAPF
jgi:hypothetical protein